MIHVCVCVWPATRRLVLLARATRVDRNPHGRTVWSDRSQPTVRGRRSDVSCVSGPESMPAVSCGGGGFLGDLYEHPQMFEIHTLWCQLECITQSDMRQIQIEIRLYNTPIFVFSILTFERRGRGKSSGKEKVSCGRVAATHIVIHSHKAL